MVQERAEPLSLISSCDWTYPLERTVRTFPALCPECVLLGRAPLGPTPSLHRLRSRSLGLVRRLPRYYGSIRLPTGVHHRLKSCDLPTRSADLANAEAHGISRFPASCFRTCTGSVTARGPGASCLGDARGVAFRLVPRRRHPGVTRLAAGHVFRGSIPDRHVPLSTLRRRPHGRLRMTQGQCGWLFLQCMTLSFTTTRWFNRRTGRS
jgi:hypothetical protein